MTTVAYRAGVMASDSRMTNGDTIFSDKVQKIFRLPDGALVGFAGTPDNFMELKEWLERAHDGEQAGERPTLDDESTMLLVKVDGSIWFAHNKIFMPINDEFAAIGSGSEAARAALHIGATAEQAVYAAIKTDIYSGGDIQVANMPSLKPAPKKSPAPKQPVTPAAKRSGRRPG